MASLSLALVSALLCLAAAQQSPEVDKDCATRLTTLDPHMSQYVGKIYTIQGDHTDKTYIYHIGVCVDADPKKEDCAVLQVDTAVNSSSIHCVGKTSKSQVARSSDGVWLELTYTGGESYHSHCASMSRTARIVFLCDPNIGGMGHVDFLEENNQDDLCYYLFTVASRAVCGYFLSVGDVLLILMACLLGVWLIGMTVGVVYKRIVMGAKGWEQVPLLGCYREFGNLEADGCDLVCRSQQHSVVEYKEPSFGADTDSEEEKDDNLLPM